MKISLSKSVVRDFAKQKKKYHTRFFLCKILPSIVLGPRVAFAFSRKSGSAVLRNRFKRRIRELLRSEAESCAWHDFFFLPTHPLSQITDVLWQEERERIRHILHQQKKSSSPVDS